MSDSPIHGLPEATTLESSDLLVLEQSNTAKRITGATLVSMLAGLLDGHGGISSITYTAPAAGSLTGTLTINYVDNSTPTTLSITNGRGISGLTWDESGTPGDGRSHVGTITYNDGSTSTVTFQDGVKGDTGDQTYVWVKWSNSQPTSNDDLLSSPAAYIGIYIGLSSTAPTNYTDYAWYQYKGAKGDTGAAVASITRTIGDGSQGSQDVYTMTLDDGTIAGTFTVYQGRDGAGQVVTVNGKAVDENGDVTLTAADISDTSLSMTQAAINADLMGRLSGLSFKTYTCAGGGSCNINFSNSAMSRHIIVGIGGSATVQFMYLVHCSNSSGSVVAQEISKGSNITINTGTAYRFRVTNGSSGVTTIIAVLTINGPAPT